MPELNGIYHNRWLFENAFWNIAKNKFQQYCEDLKETKFKTSTYMVKLEV